MSDKMPESMTEEAVSEWLHTMLECDDVMPSAEDRAARAILALVRAKVRRAITVARKDEMVDPVLRLRGWSYTPNQIVAIVMSKESAHA